MEGQNKYWASLPAEEVISELESQKSNWRTRVSQNGMQRKWWKSYNMYYGRHFFKDNTYQNADIIKAGEKGEVSAFALNHYRSILQQVLVMTTSQRPAFDARAINNDADSLKQAKIANNLLEAYLLGGRFGRKFKIAAEHSLIFGKGFVFMHWNPTLGRPVMPKQSTTTDQDGDPIVDFVYEGDAEALNPSVYDVFTDQSSEDWTKDQWADIRVFENKFDVAMEVEDPDTADKIRGLDTKDKIGGVYGFTFQDFSRTSLVPVYYFFHKKSRAMPNGRMIKYVDGAVIYDGPIPYDRLPLFRIVPGEYYGSTEGYSPAFDIMGPNEALDILVSSAYTNNEANAIQKIWAPEMGDISATQLSKALSLLRGPPGAKPEPLQLTQTAPETYSFMTYLQKQMETLTGANSVVRGDPDSQLKSGVALSIVQSMAAQFNSGFQSSWIELLEDGGTFLIHLFKKFAKTDRLIAMAGKHWKGYMQSFKGDDLSAIDRVVCEIGNPMSKTFAGNVDKAKMMIDAGLVKTPQDLISVWETGQIDRVVEAPLKRADLVNQENEALMDGKAVSAVVGEAHLYHVQEHLTVINDPMLKELIDRGDQTAIQIFQNTMNHINQHKDLYQTQDPFFSMVVGEPPAPPPMMPGMPGMMPPPPGAPPMSMNQPPTPQGPLVGQPA